MIPTSIDGTDITGATIDGTDVTEITVDGQTVFTAEQILIVDDFNSQDLSPYFGNTGAFTFDSGTVFEGSHALRDDVRNNSIASTSGLANYPLRGDTIEVFMQSSGGGGNDFGTFQLFNDDHLRASMSGYHFTPASPDAASFSFAIERYDNGSATTLASVPAPGWNMGEWYRHEVVTTATDLTYTMYDLNDNVVQSVSATDSTYSQQGIGFDISPGNTNDVRYFDLMRIIR